MGVSTREFVALIVFLMAALAMAPAGYCQGPSRSPNSSSTPSTPDKETPDNRKEPQNPAAAATKPAPTPEPDVWNRETMTGDWGGARSRWKEKGIELEFKLLNFYQGVTSGGISEDSEFNGKFEMNWKFDLGKNTSAISVTCCRRVRVSTSFYGNLYHLNA